VTLLKSNKTPSEAELISNCGVGVVVTDGEITAAVKAAMDQHKAGLDENGHGEKGAIMKTAGGLPALKWASKKKVSDELSKQLIALLGEEVLFPTSDHCHQPMVPIEKIIV